ncbi:MAG: hypothetical protein OER80_07870 [Gammaproteobacteria bacterium]|nr:hypothetical protein [Gammaproteobacteria bacterium]MDH3767928.1 hypothetical protein [Gammaproteobacteria bacterium]
MTVLPFVDLTIRLLLVTVIGWLAYRSFERRSIHLGDEPTLPQYFVRRAVYRSGVAAYIAIVAGLYFLALTFWFPTFPLVEASASLRGASVASWFVNLDESHVLPIIATGVFIALLLWESRINPLPAVRDAIYDVSAIPRRAVEVYDVLRRSRLAAIKGSEREQIMSRLLIPTLDLGDFDKAGASVEYRWARNCVLFDKIRFYADQASYARLFAEPSLKWGDICISFNRMSERVAVWKRGPTHYTKTISLLTELDELNRWLCRLLAGLSIFGAGSEKELWTNVARLGGTPHQAVLKHSWKYIMTFAVALAVGVMAGRELSVFFYTGFVDSTSELRHFNIETSRWIIYSLGIYLLPIMLVFAARLTSYRIIPDVNERFYGFYALMVVMGFLVSTSASALILGLSADAENFNFSESFSASMRWGILPAMLCGFIAYQMDSLVSDDEAKMEMLWRAVARFCVWALIGMVIMLYATDDLRTIDPELRFTVVMATTLLVGSLAAVTRFKTVQSYIADLATSASQEELAAKVTQFPSEQNQRS